MNPEDRAQMIEQSETRPVQSFERSGEGGSLAEDARIIEDVSLASLDLLELRLELEDHWKTRITDQEVISLKTIRDAVDVVLKKSKRDASQVFR